MANDFKPGGTTYTMSNGSSWTTEYTASIPKQAQRPLTMDDLNSRMLNLESRLNNALTLIEELNNKNIALTQVIEYFKEVVDEELKHKE